MREGPATVIKKNRKPFGWRRWLRLGFVLWAITSTTWLANSMRTQGVSDSMLQSTAAVTVVEDRAVLAFMPVMPGSQSAVIFICGSGIAASAYAPLLRPVAEAGYPVFVIKLPYRFAPLEAHKQEAMSRVRRVITTHPGVSQWLIAGHSLGGALAARLAQTDADAFAAIMLIGTTHPKEQDLSSLPIPVTKVFGSNDGVAPRDRVLSNRELLPDHTKWIEVEGGNHSQFGRYGHQLLDGNATISREQQEGITRAAIFETLHGVADE